MRRVLWASALRLAQPPTCARQPCRLFSSAGLARPWEILGIDEKADDKAIKVAYRKLALKYHPDRASIVGMQAERNAEKFREVTTAYESCLARTKRGDSSRRYGAAAGHAAAHAGRGGNTGGGSTAGGGGGEGKGYAKAGHQKYRPDKGEKVKYDFNAWEDAHYGSGKVSETVGRAGMGMGGSHKNTSGEWKDFQRSAQEKAEEQLLRSQRAGQEWEQTRDGLSVMRQHNTQVVAGMTVVLGVVMLLTYRSYKQNEAIRQELELLKQRAPRKSSQYGAERQRGY